MDLNEIVHSLDSLTAQAHDRGFTDVHYFIEQNRRFHMNIYHQETDQYVDAEICQVFMEANANGFRGITYFEDLRPAFFPGILDQLSAVAAGNREAYHAQPFTAWAETAPELENSHRDQVPNLLRQADQAAYDLDPRVEHVSSCRFSQIQRAVTLLDDGGNLITDRTGWYNCEVEVVVRAAQPDGTDEVQTAYTEQYSRNFDDLDPSALACQAAKRALSLLQAESLPTGSYPVLLENRVVGLLLGGFLPVFSADECQRGTSAFKGLTGQTIASPLVRLVEDPAQPGGIVTRSFDDEGTPTQRTALIENGTLCNLLYNNRTAEQEKRTSTGNGFKHQYRENCSTLVTNLLLEPGQSSFDALVHHMGRGVIITSIDGLSGGIQTTSGMFSLIAQGFWVEDGQIVRPVTGITVGGTLTGLLQGVEEVGADLTTVSPDDIQFLQTPSLRIAQLNIAGL